MRIVPDASRFIKDLEADLKRRKAEFAVQVSADMTRAAADMDRWRAEQQRNAIKVPVELDTRNARNEVERLTSGFGGGSGGSRGSLLLQVGFLGLAELPAAATAITNVAGAIQQLAGAGAVLPGVFAGILADVGTAKLGLMGVGDAFKAVEKASDGSAKNIDAANAALAKLAPQAAEFVKSVEGLHPAFDKLQKDVQGKLFSGLGQEVQNLAKVDLPILQKGLGGIATAFNQNLKQLGTTLGSAPSQGILDRILGNTGDAQARLSKAIDPIVNAFGTLAAAGSDTLPRLADGVGKLAERFDHFILAADDSGKLSKWINDGITGFDHLGNTLLNLGKSFTAITQAAGGDGGLLKLLDDGSHKLSQFLNSTQGQDTLRKFFADGREEIKQLIPILQSLPSIAQGVFQASKDAAGIWLPVLQTISGVLRDQPGLVRAIADAFLAWKFVGVITGVVDAVKGLSIALGLIGPAAATAGAEGAAGLAPLTALLANPALAAILAAGAFGAGIGPLLNAGPDARHAREHAEFNAAQGRNPGVPAVVGPVQGPTAGPVGPSSGPQLPVTPPVGAAPGYGTRPGGTVIPVTPLDPRNPFAGYAKGGPTPAGRGNGPTGGWISELHGDEWVLPARARTAVGDKALWALTSGRSFAPGGFVDEFGNPITPGAAPGGPAPIAPAPGGGGGGGINAIVGSIASGIQGPIGNALSLGSSLAGSGGQGGAGGGGAAPSLADRFAQVPGIAGLIGSAGSSDPAGNLLNWGQQTGQWLGNFTAKTAGAFGTALWQGALGLVGLDNSILSPTNPWFQAGQQGASGVLGGLSALSDGSGGGQGSQSATDLAALQQSGVAHLTGDRGGSSPGASRAIDYAQTHAVGQKYQYGGIGPNYDCSGIASAIYAAAKGLPEGTRYFTTESDFTRLGFVPGYAPGALNVGIRRGGGGPNSHMALTLPNGVNVESGGSGNTTQYGGSASGAQGFPLQYHLSLSGNAGVGAVPGVYSAGGASRGPGGPKGDQIPALLSDDEHVFTADDVRVMGGQGAVYAFRKGLHRAGGGNINKLAVPWGVDPHGSKDSKSSAGPFRPWWDMDWMPPEHPERVGPGKGWWWEHGPTKEKGIQGGPFGPPIGKTRRPRAGDFYPGMIPDPEIKTWGFADGGAVTGLPVDPYKPFPRPPEAQKIQPRPVAPPTPSGIGPPALQPPAAAPPPPAPPAPVAAAPAEQPKPVFIPGGVAPVAAPPSSYDHNLPAINTAIDSTASTLGNIASQAIAAGMGGAGIPGGGAAGQFAAGLIQQGGKIAKNVVNIGSSFLVGNLAPGTNANAYGETNRPAQNAPQTAPLDSSRTYIFHGVDSRNIVDDIRIKDAQDQQATLARYG